MRALLVIAVVIGVASADVGLGYQYKVPHTSYGVPSYPIGSGTHGNFNTGYPTVASSGYKGQSGYYGVATGTQNLGSYAGYHSSSSGGTQFYPGSAGSGTAGTISSTLVQPNYQYAGQSSSQSAYQTFNNQYQTSNYQHKNQYQQQPPQLFKHFYVHAAPEEPEQAIPRKPIVLPAPQKHYKIIFIKTPTQAAVAPQYVPVAPQTEEKTIVYVLVNKAQENQEVVVPKVEYKPPSKPEVYFIKYNSKEGSQAVINNIVNDYNDKGQAVNVVGSGAGTLPGFFNVPLTVSTSSSFSGQSSQVFSDQPAVTPGQVASAPSESELLASLGTPFGQASHSHSEDHGESHGSSSYDSSYSNNAPSHDSASSSVVGSESSSSGSVSSGAPSVAAAAVSLSSSTQTDNTVIPISTSQGVPHETYGVPKFKV